MKIGFGWGIRTTALGVLLWTTVVPARAANIDVSGSTWVTVNTGETLAFTIPEANFAQNARALGLSELPTSVAFQFVTAPMAAGGQFAVSLESADGSFSVAMPSPAGFVAGTLAGSRYNGPVSALSGTLNLSEEAAGSLFRTSSATLVLRNMGASMDLGLSPYILREDMYVSLRGDSFSVGAQQGSVVYDPPNDPGTVAAPEPGTAVFLALGGVAVGLARAGAGFCESPLSRSASKRIRHAFKRLQSALPPDRI